jgi:MFS family permease
MAIRESAASLGLITAPLLVEFLLRFVSWRDILRIFGASSILMGGLFLWLGQGGNRKGGPPNLKEMRRILSNRSFWIMAALFALCIGAQFGVYAMLPLFLVNQMGIGRELANTIIGFSQISAAVCLFFSGLVADRMGHQPAMVLFVATTGALTLSLGVFHGSLTTPLLIFLQTTSAACFFPAGLAMVSAIFPAHLRSLAISLVALVGYLLGAGLVPLAIGHLAETWSFSVGFSLVGLLVLAMLPLLLSFRAYSKVQQ